MGADSFNLIAQELLKQQRTMQQLQAENRELRRQLADLREARGIYIEICGQRFAIDARALSALQESIANVPQTPTQPLGNPGPATPVPPVAAQSVQPVRPARVTPTPVPPPAQPTASFSVPPTPRQSLQQTQKLAEPEEVAEDDFPLPTVPEVGEISPMQAKKEEEMPTFLEEIMIDEFAAASTNPMAVWNGPTKAKSPEEIEEERKAALRRELMGSFLLE